MLSASRTHPIGGGLVLRRARGTHHQAPLAGVSQDLEFEADGHEPSSKKFDIYGAGGAALPAPNRKG